MYNVLIVDDDTLMRNALRAMISRFKNFQIIGEALKIMAIWIPDSIIQKKTATAIKVQ